MVEYRVVQLWADRVRLVKMYLESPGKWPDGIDTKYNRWFSGHEEYWGEQAGRLDGRGVWQGGVNDEGAHAAWGDEARGRGRPKVEGERPWEAEGLSRRTWYRRQAK